MQNKQLPNGKEIEIPISICIKLIVKADVNEPASVIDTSSNKQLSFGEYSIPTTAVFYKKRWKKSRIKNGSLIRRFSNYSVSEDTYGVKYLFVLSRKPDRTSGDRNQHPTAGYFSWKTAIEKGLVVKEAVNVNAANRLFI